MSVTQNGLFCSNADEEALKKQNGIKILNFVNFSNRTFVLSSLCIFALLLAAQNQFLEGMHWHVPIYLYQAKRFAETHYLLNYIHHAKEIAAQVDGHWPADEAYSESYWRFLRLGHLAVLGSIVGLPGLSIQAIITMTWLYTLFLIGGLVFLFFITEHIGRTADQLI